MELRKRLQFPFYRPQSQYGYTLVEILIYVAILISVTVFVVNNIIQFSAVFARARNIRRINNVGMVAVEQITREIRLASAVDLINSNIDTNPQEDLEKLALNSFEGAGSTVATTTQFYVSGGRMVMHYGDPNATDHEIMLSPKEVTILKLKFHRMCAPVECPVTEPELLAEAIHVEVQAKTGNAATQITTSFEGTAVLRGSYTITN